MTKITEFPVLSIVFTSVIAIFTFTPFLEKHCWYNRTKQFSFFSDTQFSPIRYTQLAPKVECHVTHFTFTASALDHFLNNRFAFMA